jgi:transposase-like protein
MNELNSRGVKDILLAPLAGWPGFPVLLPLFFPKPRFGCVWVPMARNSVWFVLCKDHKVVAAALKTVYPVPLVELAVCALEDFAAVWGIQIPADCQIMACSVERGCNEVTIHGLEKHCPKMDHAD